MGEEESSDEPGRRATSPIGGLADPRAWYLVLAFGLAMFVFAWLTADDSPRLHSSNFLVAAGCCGVMALLVPVLAAGTFATRAAIRRERTWLRSLPFEVRGHLGGFGRRRRRFKITFRTADPSLGEIDAQAAAAHFGALWVSGQASPFSARFDFPPGSDHQHWRAWHRLVAELLLPLNAKWPIAVVEVDEED